MTIKVDHNFSSNHLLLIRENWTNDRTGNTQFGALIASNRGRTIDTFDNTAVLSDTYIMDSQTINQFRFAWGYNNLNVTPTDPFGPELNITGFGLFGREIFLPSKAVERRDRLPTQPLGFTSTFDQRQFQLGLRILFQGVPWDGVPCYLFRDRHSQRLTANAKLEREARFVYASSIDPQG